MENQCDPIIREMAQGVLQEFENYRELKKLRKTSKIWKPKAVLTAQQELAFLESTCDPLLQELAKIVLEEVQYGRNQRSTLKYVVYILILLVFAVLLFVITGFIIWEVAKPPTIKPHQPLKVDILCYQMKVAITKPIKMCLDELGNFFKFEIMPTKLQINAVKQGVLVIGFCIYNGLIYYFFEAIYRLSVFEK